MGDNYKRCSKRNLNVKDFRRLLVDRAIKKRKNASVIQRSGKKTESACRTAGIRNSKEEDRIKTKARLPSKNRNTK